MAWTFSFSSQIISSQFPPVSSPPPASKAKDATDGENLEVKELMQIFNSKDCSYFNVSSLSWGLTIYSESCCWSKLETCENYFTPLLKMSIVSRKRTTCQLTRKKNRHFRGEKKSKKGNWNGLTLGNLLIV